MIAPARETRGGGVLAAMANFDLTLRGDQIGRFDTLAAAGNGTAMTVTRGGVRALGPAAAIYTVRMEQVTVGETQIQNGQFMTIFDATGAVVMPKTTVQPDRYQGRGGGDEHLIVPGPAFVIDLRGLAPGPATMVFDQSAEAAGLVLGDNDGELDFTDIRADFPCFARGVRIETPDGDRTVETLRAGDPVMTLDSGPQPVLWIGRRRLVLGAPGDPRRPVAIRAGALGPLGPSHDLTVSAQHRILLVGQGASGVLGPARGLLGLRGVRVLRGCRSVEYFAILLPAHGLLRANGCWTESFYPGRWILSAMPPGARRDLLRAAPGLGLGAVAVYGPMARPALNVRQTRALCAA
jgi:hypothetical protein